MYNIIRNIIDHSWVSSSSSEQSYIYYCCCAMILVLTVVFIDLIYRIFRHCWRG